MSLHLRVLGDNSWSFRHLHHDFVITLNEILNYFRSEFQNLPLFEQSEASFNDCCRTIEGAKELRNHFFRVIEQPL
jgi:hypothetical protein